MDPRGAVDLIKVKSNAFNQGLFFLALTVFSIGLQQVHGGPSMVDPSGVARGGWGGGAAAVGAPPRTPLGLRPRPRWASPQTTLGCRPRPRWSSATVSGAEPQRGLGRSSYGVWGRSPSVVWGEAPAGSWAEPEGSLGQSPNRRPPPPPAPRPKNSKQKPRTSPPPPHPLSISACRVKKNILHAVKARKEGTPDSMEQKTK